MKVRSIRMRKHFSNALRIVIWNMEFKRLTFQVHSFKSTASKKFEAILRKIALSRFFGRLILLFLPSINHLYMIDYPMTMAILGSGKRNKLILDIGTGLSCFPSFLANRGHTVICLDVERNLLIENNLIIKKMKRRLLGEILFIVADAQHLPFKDRSVPQVTSISTFQFIPGDARAASEIGRILAADGICIISVTYSLKSKSSKRPNEGAIQRFYTDKDLLTRIVNPSGLKLDFSYLFGKEISKHFYSALPIFRAILDENPFVDVGLHFLECLFKSQSKNANGVILKLCSTSC